MGENGPKYLEPTLDKPRWLFRLDPVKVPDLAGRGLGLTVQVMTHRVRRVWTSSTSLESWYRISSPNPPGDERAAAALVWDYFPELQLPGARIIARNESRPNLLITLDFGPGRAAPRTPRATLTPSPVADAIWSVDPFGADVEGDRLYGLAPRT